VASQVLAEQLREIGMHEIGQAPADELRGARRTAELRESRVGDEDAFALDRDRLVHRLDQSPQHRFAIGSRGLFALQALHHAIDIERELGGVLARGIGPEADVEIAVARSNCDAIADLAQFVHMAVAPVQHCSEQRDQRTQPTRTAISMSL
jgi:hypothetical protein